MPLINKNIKLKVFTFVNDYFPPVLSELFIKLLVVLDFYIFSSKYKSIVALNKRHRGRAKSDTAFLIATGPSLKEVELGLLKGKDCFTVSNAVLHPEINDLNVLAHFVAPYHEPLIKSNFINWLHTIDKKLSKNTEVFMSCQSYSDYLENTLFANRNVSFLFTSKVFLGSGLDLCRPILSPQSIPILALPVLAYMGYKNIVLLGCDHTILRDYGGSVNNFYSSTSDPRSNATTGDNWKAGIIAHLRNALNLFEQYRCISTELNKNGIKIYNASNDSWLDFVEPISFHDSLKL